MDEKDLNEVNPQPTFQPAAPRPAWNPPAPRVFPIGKHEWAYGLGTLFCALGAANCMIMGGLNVGVAIFMAAYMLLTTRYLFAVGKAKADGYSLTLIALSTVIALSFLRNSDGLLKFMLLVLVIGAYPLGLTIMTGKNRWDANGAESVLDAFATVFNRGFGDSGVAVTSFFKSRNKENKRRDAVWNVLKGLLIALPLVVILLVLLREADAAFEEILRMLPDIKLGEVFITIIAGGILAFPLLGMELSLAHEPTKMLVRREHKRIPSVTVNTVLISVCVIYAVYLVSQLAYFVDGFSGLLPKGYTAAQYARRGFFEMAVICAINLGTIALCIWAVKQEDGMPGLTRSLCLFIAAVTLFLVGSALSKMFLYIGIYGLTYLRVLTSLFMIWLALAVILAGMNLYKKVPYMKVLVVTAMAIAAFVSWAGLDTFVARYNVEGYLSGDLATVDVAYLAELDEAGTPYLAKLLDCDDEYVAWEAGQYLYDNAAWGYQCLEWDENVVLEWGDYKLDIREWNVNKGAELRIIRDLVQSGKLDEWHYREFGD